MSPKNNLTDEPYVARVPADIDAPDRVLYGLTARQVAILAATGALLWAAYRLLTPLVGPALVGIAAVPVAAVAAGLALGRRDGISMDRWVAAALATARAPRLLVAAGQQVAPLPAWAAPMRTAETTNTRRSTRAGSRSDTRGAAARRRAGGAAVPVPRLAPLRLPADHVSAGGVVDLDGHGRDGQGRVALTAVSTVN